MARGLETVGTAAGLCHLPRSDVRVHVLVENGFEKTHSKTLRCHGSNFQL